MNFILTGFTLSAGVLWTVITEILIKSYFPSGFSGNLENIIFTSLYFTILAFFSLSATLLYILSILANINSSQIAVVYTRLPLSLAVSFFLLLFGCGILEFAYQIEPRKQKAEIVDDYYFVIDNTGSMEWNDPQNERIRLLSQFVNKLPETKRFALVSFNTESTVNMPLQFAVKKTKNDVNRLITTLHSDQATDIAGALETTAKILSDDSKRKGEVLFISDGAPSESFMEKLTSIPEILSHYTAKKIPIHTIMLKDKGSIPDEIEYGANLLKNISGNTGGTHYAVDNLSAVNTAIQSALTIDSVRNLLTRRVSGKSGFPLYNILHVVFITFIGLLFGYIFYGIFSYIPIRNFLLLQGVVSGLLAGITLEIFMQNGFSPGICRGISNILLSTMPIMVIKTFGASKNVSVAKVNENTNFLKGKANDNAKQNMFK